MGTPAISHLRYDLDRYISELRRVANLAATFLIKDAFNRIEYIREIEDSIRNYEDEFHSSLELSVKNNVIERLKDELSLTEREYQILRMKDHVTYIITDVFEEHGIIKYAKIGGGIVAGGIEAWGGMQLAKLGKSLHMRRFQGVGVVLVAYGLNNAFESVSPLIYEHSQSGPLRSLYRKAAELAGLSDDAGDLGFSSVEFSLTVYAALRTPVLAQSPKRLIKKYYGDQPGTGKLFKNVSSDYISKWSSKNGFMKLYFAADSAKTFKVKFYDGDYQYDDSFSLKD